MGRMIFPYFAHRYLNKTDTFLLLSFLLFRGFLMEAVLSSKSQTLFPKDDQPLDFYCDTVKQLFFFLFLSFFSCRGIRSLTLFFFFSFLLSLLLCGLLLLSNFAADFLGFQVDFFGKWTYCNHFFKSTYYATLVITVKFEILNEYEINWDNILLLKISEISLVIKYVALIVSLQYTCMQKKNHAKCIIQITSEILHLIRV